MVKSANQETFCPKCGRPVPSQGSYCPSCGTRIFRDTKGNETADPYLGQVIDGTFEVESILGTGSMGIVYKARHKALDCYVALKVLRHDFLSDKVVLSRFQREAQAASLLAHPNVIRILHYGKTSLNAPYIAMECLTGTELAVLIPKEFPLNQLRICSIILQTARALSAAHAANIIHRDLKPANIVVTSVSGKEVVKVLDFGIAKLSDVESKGLTKEGAICGTPAFMSPEQILGKAVTPASDLFSLGSILYYMLTCKLPFLGTTMPDMANSILTTEPPEPSKVRLDNYVDPKLEAVCLKALKKNPSERYQSAEEVIADIEEVIKSLSTGAAQKKQRIIVGEIDDDVDLSAETRCGFIAMDDSEGSRILDEFKKQYVDDDDSDEAGTRVEMKAMDDDVMDTTPGVAKEPGVRSAIHAVTNAVSGLFETTPDPKSLAAGEKTIIRPSYNEDQDPSEIDLAEVEEIRRQRKKMFLAIIVVMAAVCILCLVFLGILSGISHSSDQNGSNDEAGIPVAENQAVPENEPEASKDEELSPGQLNKYREMVADNGSESAVTAAAVGLPKAEESEPEPEPEAAPEQPAPRPDNAEKPKPTPKPESVRASNKPSTSKSDSRSGSSKSDSSKTNKSKTSSGGSLSPAERRMKQAQSLEAAGDKIKACDLYKDLSRDASLSQSDRLKVQNKVRACTRANPARISI